MLIRIVSIRQRHLHELPLSALAVYSLKRHPPNQELTQGCGKSIMLTEVATWGNKRKTLLKQVLHSSLKFKLPSVLMTSLLHLKRTLFNSRYVLPHTRNKSTSLRWLVKCRQITCFHKSLPFPTFHLLVTWYRSYYMKTEKLPFFFPFFFYFILSQGHLDD